MASQPARDDVSLAERGDRVDVRVAATACRGDGVKAAMDVESTPSPRTQIHRTPLFTLVVVINPQMSHAVGHHDLLPAELVLRRVHGLAQQLVQRLEARQDHRARLHLDDPLS